MPCLLQVETTKVPEVFLELIAKSSNSQLNDSQKDTNTSNINAANYSLGSISAVVKLKEDIHKLAKLEDWYSDSSSQESSESDEETDDEEYQCSLCKLIFIGEVNIEKHQKYSHRMGLVIAILLYNISYVFY